MSHHPLVVYVLHWILLDKVWTLTLVMNNGNKTAPNTTYLIPNVLEKFVFFKILKGFGMTFDEKVLLCNAQTTVSDKFLWHEAYSSKLTVSVSTRRSNYHPVKNAQKRISWWGRELLDSIKTIDDKIINLCWTRGAPLWEICLFNITSD